MSRPIVKLKRVFICGFCALPLVFSACNTFPSTTEVDAIFVQWDEEESNEVRAEIIQELLDRICVTNNADEGKVAYYALDKLVDKYRETEDESILVAVDNAPMVVGGFMNDLAGLYRRLLDIEACRERYRTNPDAREILYQRAALALDRSEIDTLLKLNDEHQDPK